MESHEKYLFDAIIDNGDYKKNSSDNEYLYFKQYKNSLLNRFEDYSFNDLEGCKLISNDYGDVVQIVNKEDMKFKLNDLDYRDNLKNNLKLIPGIGIAKETKLKSNGYKCLNDLTTHDSYCDKATKTIEKIDKLETSDLINFVKENRYTKSCNLDLIKVASLFDIEDFKFMDIETLGLSNVPVILIGVAEIKNNKIISTQYLMEDLTQELAGLEAFLAHLDENSAHVTYNGRMFDVPFIRNRLHYYGNSSSKLAIPHFDLLYYSRNLWRDKLPNCKLQTIEKEMFGLERQGDVPGQYIPDYYNTYLTEGNIGPLIPIIEHNKQDIISLASFLEKIYAEVNGD